MDATMIFNKVSPSWYNIFISSFSAKLNTSNNSRKKRLSSNSSSTILSLLIKSELDLALLEAR